MRHVSRFLQLLALILWTSLAAPAGAAYRPPAAQPEKTHIGALNNAWADRIVEVRATVESIRRPGPDSKAPFKIKLADPTGSITLVVWQDLFEVIESRYALSAGDTLRVRAKVSEYQGELQLSVKKLDDIDLLSKGAPTAAAAKTLTSIANISNSTTGRQVTVEATIVEVREPRSERAPYVITLSDSTGKIPMVYWRDTHPKASSVVRLGNTVRATGLVNMHRDTLQLKLEDASNLTLISEAPIGGTKTGIGSITDAWEGRVVTITGTITASDGLPKGQKLHVRDDSGEILVIVWDDALGSLKPADLRADRKISITGQVKIYRGKLEVIPSSPDGIKLLDD
jgi:DNA/RNA endonuclease YhcR with UshA esterase domain